MISRSVFTNFRSVSGTETYRLTAINTSTNTQSQILSPQMSYRVQNGPSSTSRRASTQTSSVVSTKQKCHCKESNNYSMKISVPKLTCTYSQNKKEFQQKDIPEIQLSDENKEAELENSPLLSTSITTDEFSNIIKDNSDEKGTLKSQDTHDTDLFSYVLKDGVDETVTIKSTENPSPFAANNILHIDVDDSVSKHDRTIQTTPVIWL